VRTVLWLLISWAVGLAVYGGALVALRGEVLSLDNWTIVGSVTLVTWLVSSMLVILPILRQLITRRFPDRSKGRFALMGAVLAIVPLWLNIGFWYGWHPRHLLVGEAGFLGVHYATSGLVLGLSLPRHRVAQSKD
jgi:hypothetical protein